MDSDQSDYIKPSLHDHQTATPHGADGRELFLSRVIHAHRSFYDFWTPWEYDGRTFDAYGEYHNHAAQYVLVKRAQLWAVDTHDYLFIETRPTYSTSDLETDLAWVTQHGIKRVVPKKDHMSSSLTLIIITDSASDEVMRAVTKTRFRKNYLLGIHGWTDLRLSLVNLSAPAGHQVVCNTAGKPLKKVLVSNLAVHNNDNRKDYV